MAPIRGTTVGLARRNNAENNASNIPGPARKRGAVASLGLVKGVGAGAKKRPLGLSNKENVLVTTRNKENVLAKDDKAGVAKKPRVTRSSKLKAVVPRVKPDGASQSSSESSQNSTLSSQPLSQASQCSSQPLSQSSTSSQEKSSLVVACSPEVHPTPERQRRRPLPLKPAGVVNFDSKTDYFGSSELVRDIFEYFREREHRFVCNDYLAQKTGSAGVLKPFMRPILVDWMVEVQEEFELTHETLYLGVKLVDRFLSRETVSKDELQLVGSVCMYLAAKYEEKVITLPFMEQIQGVCQSMYSAAQIKRMERRVFRGVGFDLGMPTSYTFLRRYARTAGSPNHELTLARYILETSLMDYDLSVNCLESKKAGAALYLARRMMNVPGPIWNESIQWHTELTLEEIKPDVQRLHRMMKAPPKDDLTIIRNKYSHEVFQQVATVPVPNEIEF